jgi:hypothetical protein
MILRLLVLLVLLALVVARVRRWLGPRIPPRPSGPPVEAGRKCADCGAWVVGAHPAPCARPDCPFR